MMKIIISVFWCFFSSTKITNGDNMKNSPPCNYTAIYNFGDSNSDTGGIAAAFYPPASPSGDTYFHRPAGRASDGRLIIDFLADNLGIPYLSPYLDSVASNYRHGANFATGGATIQRPKEQWFENGMSPFPLEIQVEHFTQFKDRTAYFYRQAKDECTKQRLPNPDELSKALFLLDIGQNDVALGIRTLSYQLQQEAIPKIVGQFVSQVGVLYERGARTFWIHNTGPIGCLPVARVKVKDPVAGYLDEIGCVKSQNEIALQFNKELKEQVVGNWSLNGQYWASTFRKLPVILNTPHKFPTQVVKLRVRLPDAALVYVDMYAAKYELISTAKNHGFKEAFGICCGYHGIGYDVWCGNKGNVNGSEVYAGSCPNVASVISWDGVHYSEAANRWIVNCILNGSLSDPAIAISRACLI